MVPAKSASLWENMDRQRRWAGGAITKASIPKQAGVYAWYGDGRRIYVGKAASLRSTVGGNHLSQGMCMTNSAFKRNVAEHLGIGTAADIKAERQILDAKEIGEVCR